MLINDAITPISAMARRLYHFVPVSLTEKHTRISVARRERNDIHKQQPRRTLQLFSRICWRKSALWAFSGRGYAWLINRLKWPIRRLAAAAVTVAAVANLSFW